MFFKTNEEEVIVAFQKFKVDRAALHANAADFAKEYDAEAVILGDGESVYFGGIRFNNNTNVNRDVWRKPDRQFGTSSLRSKPTKKALQDEFDAEIARWESLKKKHFPNGTEVKKTEFYRTLGFDWGDLIFSSFTCFEHQGYLYIKTSLSCVAAKAVEILGSEYEEANNAHKKAA